MTVEALRARQADGGSPPATDRGESVSLPLLLRRAVDDARWKHAAVALALRVSPMYFSRMLSGEKAITARHLRALPADIQRGLVRLWGEDLGLFVLVPVSEVEARRQLATGLFSLLAPAPAALPARASQMAKADLPFEKKASAKGA